MSKTRIKIEMFSCAFYSCHAPFVMDFEAFFAVNDSFWSTSSIVQYTVVWAKLCRRSRLIFQTEGESEVATLSVCVTETQHVWVSYHTGSTAQLGGTTSWVPEPKPCQHLCQKWPKLPLIHSFGTWVERLSWSKTFLLWISKMQNAYCSCNLSEK